MRIDKVVGSVGIKLDTSRFDRNIREAQRKLNEQIVADCDPIIPFLQGGIRNSVRYPEGVYGGQIEWDSPEAHYQYQGELYLTEDGRSYARKNEQKFPTGIPLKQHTPGTKDHWFEEAKLKNKEQWVNLVKSTAGKD